MFLKGYFEKEVPTLKAASGARKITIVNGQREEKVVDSIDFKKELEVFSKADINRPAWYDQYGIDSTFNEKGVLTQLKYEALDEGLNTRQIIIDYDTNAQVASIAIHNKSETAISATAQHLLFEAGKGYSIESMQEVPIAGEQSFKVEVKF